MAPDPNPAPVAPGPASEWQPFWDAAAREVLVRPVCDRCHHEFFVPRASCARCGSEEWAYVESTGRGVVESYTVVHRSPLADRATPYVVAIVALDEGWRMLTCLVDVDGADVAIGDPVRVGWADIDGRRAPVFVPTRKVAP